MKGNSRKVSKREMKLLGISAPISLVEVDEKRETEDGVAGSL